MTRLLRRFAAVLLASLAFASPAGATSYSVDFTDMWWNAGESGWGLNVIQQSDTLFVTFFVYGQDGTARWYVVGAATPSTPHPVPAYRFSGPLYETTGPWFGGPFNPDNVVRTQVGAATLTFDSTSTGTLEYTIAGTTVTKAITRYYFGFNSVAGTYAGGLVAIASQCASADDVGAIDMLGTTVVTQSATQASFRVHFIAAATGESAICTFTGPYVQSGRMAAIDSGSFTCVVNGATVNVGTFSMTSIDSQLNGFHARFSGRDQFCTYSGRFGGTRDATE